MLQLIDIHTYYGESHVLRGISMKVKTESIVALLGRNGAGKTTTIHSIIGFIHPHRGRIVFKGKEIRVLMPYQISRMGIGLVPQGRRIFPSLSVKENLIMAARESRQSEAWDLDKVYSLFPVLRARANLNGNLLSGGEMQMLCIGRALMTNPQLLLLDEPSEGLAPLLIREFSKTIKQLSTSGLAVLLAEQNIRMALNIANYVYILSKGEIAYESAPEELARNDKVKKAYLGVARNNLRRDWFRALQQHTEGV